MEQLMKTAKGLRGFFKVMQVVLKIAVVTCIVGLAIIAAGFLFDLDPSVIGEGYENIELGMLEFSLAEGYAPDARVILIQLAVEIAGALVVAFVCGKAIRCVLEMLEPMTEGKPFAGIIGANLKKLAVYIIIMGVGVNLTQLATTVMSSGHLLRPLLEGGAFTRVTVQYDFDLSFLVTAGVLFLLSYIFRYGEELQQLSDETL